MSRRQIPVESLPCDQSLVVMGNSYDSPPSEWRTRHASCQSCQAGFVITAAEQQFWYEELRIPYIVSINRCPECRKRQRIHRRIIARLSHVLPRIAAGEADIAERREAALTIAEGMIARLATARKLDIPILSTASIAEKGAALITALRRASKAHDDLLPVLIMIHGRLDHHRRVEQLGDELRQARQRSVVMDRAIRSVQAWLASPTKAGRDRIAEPPRA